MAPPQFRELNFASTLLLELARGLIRRLCVQSMLEPPLQATFFKTRALWLLGSIIALAVFALTPGVGSCQTPVPDFNSGWTPYQTYQGGDIDSVDMATGSLNLHIPLISFPQRGGRLRLNFVLNYNSTTVARARIGTGGNTYYQWSPSDTNDPSVVVLDDQAYGIYYAQACQPNPPCGHGTQTYYRFFSVLGFDGAQHVMGYTAGSPTQTSGAAALRSMDSTGLYLTIPNMSNWGSNSTIYDESGNQYNGLNYSSAGYGPQFGVYVYPNTSRKDTNGNTISFISGTYTDTVGRSIPAPPLSDASTNNIDTTGCTGPLLITKAVLWQVPGYNGQQYPIKFCYATGTINVQDGASGPDGGELPDGFAEGSPVLQSVVLPNAQTLSFSSGTTAWEFEYNDQDGTNGCQNVQLTGPCQFGTLSKVTFPTGGSISYTYQMYGNDAQLQRAVRTRTVSDGTTSNTWTYTYTLPSSTNNGIGTTVVTAPQMPYDSQPNDTVYTVSETWFGHFDTVFVTQIDTYKGSHTSGTHLKSVAKAFTFFTNPYYQVNVGGQIAQGLGSIKVGQQLNSETTTLSDTGQVSQTSYQYDSGFTITDPFGNTAGPYYYGLTTQSSFTDYGGTVLKQVGTSYYWQTFSSYLAANLLTLPYTVTTSNGSGTQVAQTTYAYDENNGSPQGILGNNTSVTRWLNTGTSPTTHTVYNPQGMPVQKIDARGKVTQITYDSTGAFPKQIQYPTTAGIAHSEQYSYDANTGVLNTYIDQNNKSTNYQYDYARRPTQVTYPNGGKTTLSYNDAPLPATFTVSKLLNTSNQYATTTTTVDGVGRTIETLLTTDPDCPSGDRTDTTYDGLGRAYTTSNPYCTAADSTFGITTYEYDALGRTTLIIPPDGTATSNNVSTVYNGNCSTVTDQASNSRKSCADGLGRLVEVDEPGTTSLPVPLFASAIVQGSENSIGLPTPGTGTVTLNSFNSNGTVQSKQVQTQAPAAGTGWATVNGSEQSITSQAASGSGTVTITGKEQSRINCAQVVGRAQPQVTCYDRGTVSITVNGFTKSASYGVSSTPTTIANALAGGFNGDSSSPVTATVSSAVVTLKAKTTGFSTNYSLSTSSTWDDGNFSGPSFTGTPSGSTLTGGANGGTTYDTGSVWITVNGVQSSASYGQGSTTATVASALVSAINTNSSAPVSAALSGSTVNLTAKTTGAGTNYSLTAGSSTSQPSIFSNASFTVSLSGAALTGGRNAAYTTIYDYGTCAITVNSHADSSSWNGSGTTVSSIISLLVSSINGDSGAVVTASPSGTTVNLTSKSTGANTNYPLSSSCTYDSSDFSSPSFTTSNSGSTLSGGSNSSGSTIYDSGSVWIALNGTHYTASYGQNDTSTSVATSLANVLNASSPVTATASGSTITITAKTGDAVTNYAWTASSSTNQPGYFNSPSFTPVVGVVSGSAPPSLSLSTPAITTYTYDALNNLLGVVQSSSRQRSFTYDSLSRLICASNPENSTASCPATATSNYTPGTTGYSYDLNGNLISKTSPLPNQSLTANTVTATYVPDDLNRVTQKSFNDGTPSITYVYDGASTTACTLPSVNYGLAIGMRTGMCDAAGSEAWGYTIQSAGWQTQDVRVTQGIKLTTTVQKNVDGSLNSLTYPSSRVVSYTYNGAARPITGNDSTGINYVSSANYWPSGALAALTNGTSNLYSTFILNSRLQPCWIYATTGTALSWKSTACTASTSTGNVLDLKYNFNLNTADNGNVAGITNNRDSNRSLTFVYDALNRLTTAQTTSTYSNSTSRCGAESFACDAWGNQLSKALPFINYVNYVGCTGESPFGFTIGTNNQIQNPSTAPQCFNSSGALQTTAVYCYDAAGNLMTDKTGASHYYDAENHLKSLPALGISYVYDGDGRRLAKLNSSGQATKLYWYGTGSDPLDETDGSGATTNSSFNEYAFFDGHRMARRDYQNNVYYYVADHLGTARATVQAGQTAACYDADFYPFGGERTYTDTCDSAYKFTGKERDSESGLDYFGARHYGSSLGRFMSTDPSSASIDKTNPQSWNRYSYTYNNPLAYVDHNGKWPTKIHEQIIDKAFPGLSAAQRGELKRISSWVDRIPGGQTKAHNHEHAMKSPGEDPVAAKRAIDQNIQGHEQAAQKSQGGTPEHASDIKTSALDEFGQALHTVEDRTSPAHTDQNGNPRDWSGLPVTPSEVEAVQQHESEEANITPEQMNNSVQAARDAFQQTFGTQALQDATTEPKKKEEKKD